MRNVIYGGEQAKESAVANVGLQLDSVTFTKTVQDYDDGIQKWEIEFVANNYEYEYEINTMNGVIVKSKVESVYD